MRIGLIPQASINSIRPDFSVPFIPLGLLCIAAALDEKRHAVEIIDLTMLVKDGVIKYDGNFDRSAAEYILSKKFDSVGFSSFSAGYHHTLKTASNVKKASPDIKIIFGGPQASFCDKETVGHFPVDYVVRGEGETAFRNLIECLEKDGDPSGVKGITYRRKGAVAANPPQEMIKEIDALPFPAYHLYPVKKFPKVPIEMTRGCPFKCVYCATSKYWGRMVRHKSFERIFREMERLKKEFSIETVSFADDTFTINRSKAVEFCKKMIERGAGIKWLCSTRIDAVDGGLLKLMAKAGCTNIFYGIESGSPRIQRLIRKNLDVKTVVKNLKATAASGIGVTASLMMGFPDETEKDLILTLKLRNKIKQMFPVRQTVQLHILAPDVNTEVTLANIDRLEYDGFHSDQVGGNFSPYDREMILKHKMMFLAYYYIKMRHLDRDFIKFLDYFMFAGHIMAYWSSLYVMTADKNPLLFFKKWLKFYKTSKRHPDIPPNSPESVAAIANASLFFKNYFDNEKSVPPAVRDLFRHEFERSSLKGKIASDEKIRQMAAAGEVLSIQKYDYNPEKTIAAICKSAAGPKRLSKSPAGFEYFQRGFDEEGPIIRFRTA